MNMRALIRARDKNPHVHGRKANQSPGTRSSAWYLTRTTQTGTRGGSQSPPGRLSPPQPPAAAAVTATATTKTQVRSTLPPRRPQSRPPQRAPTLSPPLRLQRREAAKAKRTPPAKPGGAASLRKTEAPLLPHKKPERGYRLFWEEPRGRGRGTARVGTEDRSGCGSGRGRTG